MLDVLSAVKHRPWPLPKRPWSMTQRWNDLLFAHWPLPPAEIAGLLPSGLEVDTFDGSGWIGVVPFSMDRIHMRGLPGIPGANRFPELNLRTYVRDRRTNLPGVYFFSLDAANPVAVSFARLVFRLPYYWANMKLREEGQNGRHAIVYTSERHLTRPQVRFRARYRSLGASSALARSTPGTIEYFLTERYRLYTADRKGRLFQGDIHHVPWPLERAEAEFECNDLPRAHGLRLPDTPPLLYYSRELVVYVWSLEAAGRLAKALAGQPLTAPEPL